MKEFNEIDLETLSKINGGNKSDCITDSPKCTNDDEYQRVLKIMEKLYRNQTAYRKFNNGDYGVFQIDIIDQTYKFYINGAEVEFYAFESALENILM